MATLWSLRTRTPVTTVAFPSHGLYNVQAVGPGGKELIGYGDADHGDGSLTIWTTP